MKKPKWFPDWFNLKNYDSVADMDLSGWAAALEIRELIASTKCIFEPDEAIERLIRASKKPPVGGLREIYGRRGVVVAPQMVSSMDVGLIGAIWSDITSDGDGAKFKKNLENGATPRNVELAERYSILVNCTYETFYVAKSQKKEIAPFWEYCGSHLYVGVDMAASDEQLIDDFKKWLKDTRALTKMESQPRKFTEADMKDWCKKRVLPYIDLTVWAKIKGIPITQQAMGNVLFPDDYDTNLADRIRRDVKPLAEKLLNSKTIGTICTQVGHSYY